MLLRIVCLFPHPFLISANSRRSTSMAHVYTIYSSSAAASNSFVRSVVAAILPIVSTSVVNATGTKWAGQSMPFCTVSIVDPFILALSRCSTSVHIRISFLRDDSDSAGLGPVWEEITCQLTLLARGAPHDRANERIYRERGTDKYWESRPFDSRADKRRLGVGEPFGT
jgi:hypothetical protein